MLSQNNKTVFRFGPFELNAAQHELRRSGVRMRLPPLRFRLLLLFVSRPADLVTREEIAATLWKDIQTIDAGSGINTAVNQLREQLGDDSAAPRYIETIVGVGYRFIATVEKVPASDAPLTNGHAKPTASRTNGDFRSQPVPDSIPIAGAAFPGTGVAPPPAARVTLATPEQNSTGQKKPNRMTIGTVAVSTALLIAAAVSGFREFAHPRVTVPPAELQMVRVTESGDVRFATISPDGNYVALVRESRGQQSIWVRQLATGHMLQLITLGTDNCPGIDFSPDGAYIYFARKQRMNPAGKLYQLRLLGGSSTEVLAGISGAPAISPDGHEVAFVRSTLTTHGQDSIVVAKVNGESERVLASFDPPGIHFDRIAWTADGSRLIFPLSSQLYSIPAVGGGAQPLPGTWRNVADLWRLASGNDFAVIGQRDVFPADQVFQVSPSTGQVAAITHDLSAYSTVRVPGNDHTLLAVQNLTLSSVQVLSPGNDSETQVISVGDLNRDGIVGLAWTPDDQIVYSSEPERRAEVLESRRDGSNPMRLLTDIEAFSDPVISPRGDFIAVVRWSMNDTANIWRMNLDGSAQKRLTQGRQDFSPSITPDGRWIVYASLQGGSSVLMKIPVDGGAAVRLTDYRADDPVISPDGKWIACTILPNSAERPKLAIVPARGGPPSQTFPLPATVTPPPLVWTPDSSGVTFVNNVDGVANIWKQPLRGGSSIAVTHFSSGRIFNFRWSPDGWLALARGMESTDAVLIKSSLIGQ